MMIHYCKLLNAVCNPSFNFYTKNTVFQKLAMFLSQAKVVPNQRGLLQFVSTTGPRTNFQNVFLV